MANQRTIEKEISLTGVGLHTGKDCTLTFKGAPANTWFTFVRADLPNKPSISATFDNAKDELVRGTVLEKDGVEVSTVEHVLAALYGLEIDNCIIELSGPEPPLLDGSAKPFADALISAGIIELDTPREYLKVDEVIQFSQPERQTDIHIIPFAGFRVTLMVDYHSVAVGTQYTTLVSLESEFLDEFAAARTFCFLSEIKMLHGKGLIKGGDLDSAIVFSDQKLTPEDEAFIRANFPVTSDLPIQSEGSQILGNLKLRFRNEPVRHKVVDLLGDLALLGAFIEGHVIGARSGHEANVALVKLLAKKLEAQRLKQKFGARGDYIDIVAIQKVLSHRYPFLLIDRVVDFENGKYAVAVKNVSFNEHFFQGHFPDHPVMPGVLQIEALAQTGAFMMAQTVAASSEEDVTLFVGIDKLRFKKPVYPGDQLVLRADMIYFKRGICKFWGCAKVGDDIVCEGEFVAALAKKQ